MISDTDKSCATVEIRLRCDMFHDIYLLKVDTN